MPVEPMRPKNLRQYRDVILSEHGPATSAARLVAVALVQRMDTVHMETFASIDTLVKATELGRNTVRRALKNLATDGWVSERTKERGRDFWIKIRTARFPAGLVPTMGTSQYSTDAHHGHQSGNGLMPKSIPTGTQIPPGQVPTMGDDLGKRSRKKDLGAVAPAVPTGRRARPEVEQTEIRSVVRPLLDKFPPERIVEFEHIKRLGVTLDEVQQLRRAAC